MPLATLRRKAGAALAAAAALSAPPRAIVVAFSPRGGVLASSPPGHPVRSTASRSRDGLGPARVLLRAATTEPGPGVGVDTDATLPEFSTKEEHASYLKAAGRLPSGFAVGTASGTFVPVEAPAMGALPIRATVIHLTEGPTDSWAAVFTGNKVRRSGWRAASRLYGR